MNMKLKLVLVVLLLAFPILMLSGVAGADSLTTGGNAFGGCTNSTNETSCSAVGSGYFSGTFSATAVGSLASGTMGTSALIDNFQLQNLSVTNGDDVSTDGFVSMSYEFAEPTDLDGGTVVFSITLSGETSASCPSPSCNNLVAQTELIISPALDETFVGLGSGSTSVVLPNGETSIEVSSTIGDGVANLGLDLYSLVACNVQGLGTACTASSDFLDPLSITGATVYDANGNIVSDASVVSESGFNPNAGVAAPEPSSLLLLGIGLLGIGVTMLRRERAAMAHPNRVSGPDSFRHIFVP